MYCCFRSKRIGEIRQARIGSSNQLFKLETRLGEILSVFHVLRLDQLGRIQLNRVDSLTIHRCITEYIFLPVNYASICIPLSWFGLASVLLLCKIFLTRSICELFEHFQTNKKNYQSMSVTLGCSINAIWNQAEFSQLRVRVLTPTLTTHFGAENNL